MTMRSANAARPDRERLQALLTDKRLSGDARAWEEYICAFHTAVLGAWPATEFLDGKGRTSYDVLLEGMQATAMPGGDALDLGCGEGFLTRMIRAISPAGALVAGLDTCASSLRRAGQVAGPEGIEFLEASATAIPFPDGRFDIVTAHLVLMLVQAASVLREVRRVLRVGGRSFFIVDRNEETAGTFARMRDVALRFIRDSYPNFVEPQLGDPRVKQRETLRELFEEAGLSRDLHLADFVVSATMTPQRACELLSGMYVFGSLDAARETAMRSVVLAHLLEEADATGLVTIGLPLRLIAAGAC